ncbi:B-block binding subunit of TFIIIC, partial [Zea mays]
MMYQLSKVYDRCYGLTLSPGEQRIAVVRSLDLNLLNQMYQVSFTSKQKQQRVGSGLTLVRRKRCADGNSLKLLKRTVQASGSAEQILGQPIVVDEEVPMISRKLLIKSLDSDFKQKSRKQFGFQTEVKKTVWIQINNQAIRGETKTSAVSESGFCDPEKSCGHSNAESENMEVFCKPQEKSLRITEIRLLKEPYGNHWLLRNPIRVEVKTEAKSTSKVAGQHELGPSITPLGLRLEYMICEASKKSSQLVDFLVHNSGMKIMVYFATCACVDYWVVVLPLINSLKGSPIIASHGKMKQ